MLRNSVLAVNGSSLAVWVQNLFQQTITYITQYMTAEESALQFCIYQWPWISFTADVTLYGKLNRQQKLFSILFPLHLRYFAANTTVRVMTCIRERLLTPIWFHTKSETQTNIKLSWKLIILTLNIKFLNSLYNENVDGLTQSPAPLV
jgi:hypothetical protein